MSLIENHMLLANKFLTPTNRQQAGGGTGGLATFNLSYGVPLAGSFLLVMIGGNQTRVINSITDGGGGTWTFGPPNSGTLLYAWKIADGTENGTLTVTLNLSMTGVVILHEWQNVRDLTETTLVSFTSVNNANSNTFTWTRDSAIVTACQTTASDVTWDNVNNDFGNVLVGGHCRSARKVVKGAGSGNVNWSGDNNRVGNIQTFVLGAKLKSGV